MQIFLTPYYGASGFSHFIACHIIQHLNVAYPLRVAPSNIWTLKLFLPHYHRASGFPHSRELERMNLGDPRLLALNVRNQPLARADFPRELEKMDLEDSCFMHVKID